MSLTEYHEMLAQAQKQQRRARGQSSDGMNQTERRYADELQRRLLAGTITSWAHEPFTFRLEDRTTYTPDFVFTDHHSLTIVEIKGHLEDDAAVKYKWARATHPWAAWLMLRWTGVAWVKVRI